MKTPIKMLACAIAGSLVILACGNFDEELNNLRSNLNSPSSASSEIPIMDSRVVAYLRVGEEDGVKGFIDDIETLKSWFPPYTNVLYNEECNYFAVTFPIENDKSYMVLSEDMTLYSIQPDPTKGKPNPVTGKIGCDFYYPPIISYQSMLICDDKAGTIKNKVNFNSAVEYVNYNWDCMKSSLVSENVYFTHVSSSSSGEPVFATEMPIMDSRVVSYQKLRWDAPWVPAKTIVTDIDTLKSWFPNDLNDEKIKECNYFAIYKSTSSTGLNRLVLSSDMVLYSLMPNGVCAETADIAKEAMLVCDDEFGTFKNKINLNGVYTDPDWLCNGKQKMPKIEYFPYYPPPVIVMPKPIMDSRVVSYQNVQYKSSKIITDTDTLKLWFPNIFSKGLAKPECNYFAMTFDHRNTYYEPIILSKDTSSSEYVLFDVRPGGAYGENCKSVIKNEGLTGAILICDDEASTMKNIIKPYDTPYYYISPGLYLDPNWDCESGIGAPEDVFF